MAVRQPLRACLGNHCETALATNYRLTVYHTSDKSLVSTLWCEVCRRYKDKIQGMRNYSGAWVPGSTNHKTSNLVDHATSEQHTSSMQRLGSDRKKAVGCPLQEYAPIVKSLVVLDGAEKAKLKAKFEICYVLARESLAFVKYAPFHALADHQGVNLGQGYKTADSAKRFTHFIAEAQRKLFLHSLSSTKFVSFLMDGSTDAGNMEQELVLVVFCVKDEAAQQIRSCTRYLAVISPERGTAEGLVDCLGEALKRLGIDMKDEDIFSEGRPALVGGGTDGASVNIGSHSGMKAHLESVFPWLFWAWCFSHRLELACKDSFTSSLFEEINEMLLRLYYLYKKSPKKSRELEAIAQDLSDFLEIPKGGNLPIRCQGTRWINHKRRALQRIVDRYGAYISHLSALAEDSSVKAADRAQLQGYLKKWSQGKVIIGCAMFVDALKPPSLLSLVL